MKINKRGISLIILVVTIVVLTIIAGAVIVTIDRSDITDMTNEYKQDTEDTEVMSKLKLIIYNELLNNKNKIDYERLKEKLQEAFGSDFDVASYLNNGEIKINGKDYKVFETGSVASGTKQETSFTQSTVIENAQALRLLDFKIYGNSVQNESNVFETEKYNESSEFDASGYSTVIYPAGDYSFSANYTATNSFAVMVRAMTTDGEILASTNQVTTSSVLSMSFSTTKEWHLRFYYGGWANASECLKVCNMLSNVYLQGGNPSPNSPIEVESVGDRTKNLFDISPVIEQTYSGNGGTISIDKNGAIHLSGRPTGYVGTSFYSRPNLSGQVTFKIFGDNKNIAWQITLFDINKNSLLSFTISSGQNNSYRTIKMEDYPTYYNMEVYIKRAENNAEMSGTAYLQIEKGTVATAYEPYGYKIPVKVSNGAEEMTTNIYLDEPLRKIGSYSDYIDFANKKVVRNIKEYKMQGTESIDEFSLLNDGSGYRGYIYFSDRKVSANQEGNMILSNRYPIIYSSYISTQTYPFLIPALNNKPIWFSFPTECNTVSLAQSWLKQQETTVLYILATPKEEKIGIQNIELFNGINTISVDTDVAPSNIEMKYLAN